MLGKQLPGVCSCLELPGIRLQAVHVHRGSAKQQLAVNQRRLLLHPGNCA